jgi:hypothetical protein
VLTVPLPTTPSEITRKFGPLQPDHATRSITAFRQMAKWALNRRLGTGVKKRRPARARGGVISDQANALRLLIKAKQVAICAQAPQPN